MKVVNRRIFYLLFLTLLTACTEDPPIKVKVDVKEPEAKQITEESTWPKEIRKEVFGDEEMNSTPRIQFLAALLDEKRELSIWSMKLDGSDRRLAVHDSEIDGSVLHLPIRSPNNRYIALSLGADIFYRAIYDLKEKKMIKIVNGGGVPWFKYQSINILTSNEM